MAIPTLLQKSSQLLLDFLFPPRCIHCQQPDTWLCEVCYSKINFIFEPVCQKCGSPQEKNLDTSKHKCPGLGWQAIDGIRAAAHFEDTPIRDAIHWLKYHNHRAIVSRLGQILSDTYHHYTLKADVIVPVPLHRHRYKERGYNQSELLAANLCALLNLPLNTSTLQRIRYTEAQVNLSVEARQKNVIDAFACQDNQLASQRVLLIDDVCTTGATLDACASALKQTEVLSVWGLTLAR